VQVDGRCEVLDLPEALEPLVDYFRSFGREHPDWEEYRQAMTAQGKCLLRITPTAGAPWPRAASPPTCWTRTAEARRPSPPRPGGRPGTGCPRPASGVGRPRPGPAPAR
jgi:hypothetical protein